MTRVGRAWDAVPVWVQHPLIVAASALAGDLANSIVAAGGVTSLHWVPAAGHALDVAVLSAIAASGLLWGTPATRRYGVGAQPAPVTAPKGGA
jgi:hypothetical protein